MSKRCSRDRFNLYTIALEPLNRFVITFFPLYVAERSSVGLFHLDLHQIRNGGSLFSSNPSSIGGEVEGYGEATYSLILNSFRLAIDELITLITMSFRG